MIDLHDYIKEENIINDQKQFYESIKDLIYCLICQQIMVKPVRCKNCQHSFCRNCIEFWIYNKNYCPIKCQDPEFQKDITTSNLLSKLNFTCPECYQVVNYDRMEMHLLSKCDTVEVKVKIDNKDLNSDKLFKKVKRNYSDYKKFSEQPQIKMKILFLGATRVGKTSLINTFIEGEKKVSQLATTNIDERNQPFYLSDGTLVSCTFVDTGGAPKYKACNEIEYKKVQGFIVVFDLTDQASFDEVGEYFLPKIREYNNDDDVPILILGNKKDLKDSRKITMNEGFALAEQYKANYNETSCLENYNLNQIFEEIIEQVRNYKENKEHYESNNLNNNINLRGNNERRNNNLNNRGNNNNRNHRRRCRGCL